MLLAAAGVLLATHGAAGQGGDAIASAYARNESLTSYTFTLHGTMHMRTFPWMSFGLDGQGVYERGVRYEVRFAHLPFFAKSFQRIDLSALAPDMWPHHFTVTYAGRDGDDDVYALRDPHDATLKVAVVHIDPAMGVREVDLQYTNGGSVDLHVTCTTQNGYLVPGVTNADVDVAPVRLAVDAQFTDYSMPGRTLVSRTHAR